MLSENQRDLITRLSGEISQVARIVANEQYCPNADPDRMDQNIRVGLSTLKRLREIRDELENIFTGVI